MTAGIKANVDGSAAIQVGGVDAITLTSAGAASFVTSPMTIQGGSAAAPSLTFSGDTNTGIFSPAADTIAFSEGGVESMRIDSAGNVGIGQAYGLTNTRLMVAGQSPGANGAYATGVGSIVLNETQRTSASDNGGFEFKTSVFGAGYGAKLIALDAGELVFANRSNSATWSERARIDSSGNLLVGRTNSSANAAVSGCIIYGSGSADFGQMVFSRGANTVYVSFRNASSGAEVGNIQTNGTNTSYVTSSDYRLKENIQPMQNALTRVASLKPCTYTWKADGSDGEGFIAHELQAVCPDAVTGEKDAVNEDGSIKPQGIDTSFLVATLTAAIQELKAELDATKAEVALLKGAA